MLHKLFIPIFRYNNKRVAILGNIRRKIKKTVSFYAGIYRQIQE